MCVCVHEHGSTSVCVCIVYVCTARVHICALWVCVCAQHGYTFVYACVYMCVHVCVFQATRSLDIMGPNEREPGKLGTDSEIVQSMRDHTKQEPRGWAPSLTSVTGQNIERSGKVANAMPESF